MRHLVESKRHGTCSNSTLSRKLFHPNAVFKVDRFTPVLLARLCQLYAGTQRFTSATSKIVTLNDSLWH